MEAEIFSLSSYSWVMVNSTPMSRDGGAGISLATQILLYYLVEVMELILRPYGYSEKYFNSDQYMD